jgi:hypothetical protein
MAVLGVAAIRGWAGGSGHACTPARYLGATTGRVLPALQPAVAGAGLGLAALTANRQGRVPHVATDVVGGQYG